MFFTYQVSILKLFLPAKCLYESCFLPAKCLYESCSLPTKSLYEMMTLTIEWTDKAQFTNFCYKAKRGNKTCFNQNHQHQGDQIWRYFLPLCPGLMIKGGGSCSKRSWVRFPALDTKWFHVYILALIFLLTNSTTLLHREVVSCYITLGSVLWPRYFKLHRCF